MRELTTDHRTVRVIRAYSLISPAPSLQESFFFLWKEPLHSAPGLPDAGLILKKTPPVGKSFLLINTPFVLLIYPDLKQNSPWCKTKVREFRTVQEQSGLFVPIALYPRLPLWGVVLFLQGALTLRIRPPGCRIDIKENAARWQVLSFNQHSLCFAYLPWFKTKLTLINSRWGS